MTTKKQSRGKKGEDLAASYLQSQGYKILERNFQKRYGEIDIIAQDSNVLVFVEVKTRWSEKFGKPESAVTPHKLKSVIRTGHYYKLLHPELPDALRVDVVAVDFTVGEEEKRVRLIKNVTM